MINKPFPAIANPSTPAEGRSLTAIAGDALTTTVDFFRLDASRRLDPARRVELGQFLTPSPVASLMASMFAAERPTVRILDAGAGVGGRGAPGGRVTKTRTHQPTRHAWGKHNKKNKLARGLFPPTPREHP